MPWTLELLPKSTAEEGSMVEKIGLFTTESSKVASRSQKMGWNCQAF